MQRQRPQHHSYRSCSIKSVQAKHLLPHAFYQQGCRGFKSSDGAAALKAIIEQAMWQWSQHNKWHCGGSSCWPGGSCSYFGSRSFTPAGHSNKPSPPQSVDVTVGSATTAATGSLLAGPDTPQQLRLDVVSRDGLYLLFADVPGLSKSALNIRLSKERLITISGNRPDPVEGEGFVQRERCYGRFERQWQLPDDADVSSISAKVVAAGQLIITVPKKTTDTQLM